MIRRFAAGLAACVLSSVASPATAQDSPSENDLVVVGNRLQEMVRGFVGEVAAAPGAEQQMARWDGRICPLVAGLPARQMQYVADRIAQRAHQVDIDTEGPGCKANILIFVTPDASRLAQGIVDEYRSLVAYYSASGVLRAELALDSSSDAQLLRQLAWTLLASALAGAVVVSAGGAWLVQRALLPVRDLARQAAALSPENVGQPLDGSAQAKELQPLVAQFNACSYGWTTHTGNWKASMRTSPTNCARRWRH